MELISSLNGREFGFYEIPTLDGKPIKLANDDPNEVDRAGQND